MDISSEAYRRVHSHWLRTGRWLIGHSQRDIELKFNPYHDPRNGQFTFAPGGPRSLSHVVVSHGRREAGRMNVPATRVSAHPAQQSTIESTNARSTTLSEAVYRPEEDGATFAATSLPRPPGVSRGSNSRAFQDPITLQQAFPGLQGMPGGAILALGDSLLDVTGPARELTSQLTHDLTNTLINQIKAIDPHFGWIALASQKRCKGSSTS